MAPRNSAAAVAVWYRCYRVFHMDLGLGAFARIGMAAATMAAGVLLIGYLVPGYAGLALSIIGGAILWFVVLRLSGALDASDRERLLHIGRVLPSAARPLFHHALNAMIAVPREAAAASGRAR